MDFALLALGVFLTAVAVSMLGLMVVGQFMDRQKSSIDAAAKTDLADMFIFVDSNQLFVYNMVALLVFPPAVYLIFDGFVLPIIVTISIAFIPKYLVSHLRKTRISTFERQLPDALLMVSGGMRAGASLAVALESMVKEQKPPLAQEFDLMLREQRLGIDFDTALSNMEKRMPLPDFILLVAAMRITKEVGGNFAEILESLSITLRRKLEMEGKIKALTAQGKLQGIVMACLPLFLMGILTLMEQEAMAPLYNTLYGWITLFVIFVMVGLGYLGISKIVNIDV
jgi:tight adherence protein B